MAELLFIQWVYYLAGIRLGITSYSGPEHAETEEGRLETWSFAHGDDRSFSLSLLPVEPWLRIESSRGLDEKDIVPLVQQALEESRHGNYGDQACYAATLVAPEPDNLSMAGVQMLRILGDQVAIQGTTCLTDSVVLDLETDVPPEGQRPLVVPRTSISVKIFAPGPGHGPLSYKVAQGLLETIRLICTFVLGRNVLGPKSVFPASDDEARVASNFRSGPSASTLARNGVGLDFFGTLLPYAPDTFQNVQQSLVAFDAAIAQDNADVATILFVAGIESLLTPNTEWRRSRPAARFVKGLLELTPNTVDAVLAHGNAGQAFPIKLRGGTNRRRHDLLNYIYELRSAPVHSGPTVGINLLTSDPVASLARVALLSELHRNALVSLLPAPRSFLTGHPVLWPGKAGTSSCDTDEPRQPDNHGLESGGVADSADDASHDRDHV